MSDFGEYSTIHNTREVYLSSVQTKDDPLLLSFIRQASREIDRISHRTFYPTFKTNYYNTPNFGIYDILLEDELIQATSVLNGDGSVINVADLFFYPLNAPIKTMMRLLPTISTWKCASNGYPDKAITVTGQWGHVYDRTAGWRYAVTTAIPLTSSTYAFEVTAGVLYVGQIIRIDDEFMYVFRIDPPTTLPVKLTDTVNVIREINGSTAVSHLTTLPIYIWEPGYDIGMLTAAAAVAFYNLKSNPMASAYTIDGVNFQTPKDVSLFIHKRLAELSQIRVGFA